MSENLKEEALKYHREGKPGKIEVVPTKPYSTQRDLSMAYTPGVAQPCLEIEKKSRMCIRLHCKRQPCSRYFQWNSCFGIGRYRSIVGQTCHGRKGSIV